MSKLKLSFDDEVYPVRRVLMDVTDSVRNRGKTGIQRVCRSLCHASREIEAEYGIPCVPVSIHHDRFFYAKQIFGEFSFDEACFDRLATASGKLRSQVRRQCARISPDLDDFVCRVATRIRKTLYPKSLVRSVVEGYGDRRRRWFRAKDEVIPQFGDALVLMDSSWNLPIDAGVVRAKSAGSLILPVVHDLIPLRFNEFHQPVVRERFEKWFAFLVEQADHFLSVSNATSDDVRELSARYRADAKQAEYQSFRLGASFTAEQNLKVRPRIRAIFDDGLPVFLNVSTVEPRKNQTYLLDAFEKLWGGPQQAKLVIAGKAGWMSEDLQRRLQRHPKKDQWLFWIQDATDQEISFLYQQARAFLFPSIIEGFGLPIIESLYHRTPVFASDTKIHREVGKTRCQYFSLDEQASLVKLVSQAIHSPKPTLEEIEVLDWKASCRQLLDRVISFSIPERFQAAKAAGESEQARWKPAA